jgi:hypothetical protein
VDFRGIATHAAGAAHHAAGEAMDRILERQQASSRVVQKRTWDRIPLRRRVWIDGSLSERHKRMVGHFDDKANNGGVPNLYGTTMRKYKDAAEIVIQPSGAESNLTSFFRGRFGRGGPGSNAQDVLDLIERHMHRPDTNAFVLDYVGTLDPAITPFDVTKTIRGPISRMNHEWFETLTPAYDLMISDMNAYVRSAGIRPRGLAKLQRIRQQLDLPDGVRLPGRVRSLRGAPGVPPPDLREWLSREGVRDGADSNAPPYYNSSMAYLHLVVDTWRHIEGFIRRSGGLPLCWGSPHEPYELNIVARLGDVLRSSYYILSTAYLKIACFIAKCINPKPLQNELVIIPSLTVIPNNKSRRVSSSHAPIRCLEGCIACCNTHIPPNEQGRRDDKAPTGG